MPPNPKVVLARERLLGLEAQTTSQQARPMRDRLCAWRNEVRSALTATELARLYVEFIAGTEGPGFDANMAEVRKAATRAMRRTVSMEGVLHHLSEYRSKIIHVAWKRLRDAVAQRTGRKRSWKQMSSGFATSLTEHARQLATSVGSKTDGAKFSPPVPINATEVVLRHKVEYDKAVNLIRRVSRRSDEHLRREQRFVSQVERPLARGKGFIVLNPGARLASDQLAEARAGGLPMTTVWHALQWRSTGAVAVVEYNTDTLLLPPLGTTCMFALLAGLMGASLGMLGVANDPIVKLNPALVSFADILALRDRARRADGALGGLRLPRLPGLISSAALLRLVHGVYWFAGVVRHGERLHPHAIGWNAGASLFYLNPWVIIVEASDRLHPDLFFARLERIYGVMVPPRVACRILGLEMARAEPHTLPIACSPPQPARESASQSRKRRRGGKGVRRGGKSRSGKRARADST